MDLRQHAHRLLRELQRRTGHTVHMAQRTGDEIIYIDKVDSPAHRGFNLPSRVGNAVSIHASAVGKVILAHLPREDRERLLSYVTLERHTATTITDRDAFEVELASVRHRGWAADDGEHDSYIACVAVPVRDPRGQVVAAISVSSVEAVAPLSQLEENLPALLATARGVSAELGHAQ